MLCTEVVVNTTEGTEEGSVKQEGEMMTKLENNKLCFSFPPPALDFDEEKEWVTDTVVAVCLSYDSHL